MGEKKITVPLSGLKEGLHNFDFKIDSSFFEQFEYSEIQKGKADIKVILSKSQRLMTLEITIAGEVEAECDLCLEMFDLPFNYKGKLYVKYGVEDEDSDEILFIEDNASKVDLTQYIYESVYLSLPYKKNHPVDSEGKRGCNKTMIDKLNEHITDNEIITDPRWDKLKDILN